jgi:hypothetical protein
MSGRILGPLIIGEMLLAGIVSGMLPDPHRLPVVALGSGFLLDAYRGLVIFVPLYALTVIITRSFEGALATKIGGDGIEWGSKAAADSAAEQMLKLNLRLDDQQMFIQRVMLSLIEDRRDRTNLETLVRRIDEELQRTVVHVADLRRRNG